MIEREFFNSCFPISVFLSRTKFFSFTPRWLMIRERLCSPRDAAGEYKAKQKISLPLVFSSQNSLFKSIYVIDCAIKTALFSSIKRLLKNILRLFSNHVPQTPCLEFKSTQINFIEIKAEKKKTEKNRLNILSKYCYFIFLILKNVLKKYNKEAG